MDKRHKAAYAYIFRFICGNTNSLLRTMAFEGFQPQKQQDEKTIIAELVKRLNQNASRLHMAEQKIDRVETTIRTLDETALTQMNNLKLDLDRISSKIADVADRLVFIESEVARMNARMEKTATRMEVKQLESFIDIINPITSKFVTKDELERAVEDRLATVKKRV